jgi:cell division septum initiation protein DivIVA
LSGVFLSYSRGDRALADQIIRGFRAVGVVVWWDEDMPGVDWQQELERQIKELTAVVVVWTEHSANSANVRDEARLGLSTEKLVNVLAGVAQPPFPFDRVNGLPLDGWTGREPHKGWTRVVQTVETLMVKAGRVQPGEITEALTRSEKEVRLKQQAVARAMNAFQTAQAREGETAEAVKAAAEVLGRAEEQHERVVEMRATPALERMAQEERDAARVAKAAADQTQRAARDHLSEASRGLARAQAALEKLVAETMGPQASPAGGVISDRPVLTASPPRALADNDAAPADRAVRPSMQPWLAAAGVAAAIVVAGLGVLALRHGQNTTAQPIAVAAAGPAAASGAAPSAAPAPDPAATVETAIAGKWTLQNVSCAYAIQFAVTDGALSVGGTPVKIDSVDAKGVIQTGADNGGDAYAVTGDTLTITTPGGDHTSYTRCAG